MEAQVMLTKECNRLNQIEEGDFYHAWLEKSLGEKLSGIRNAIFTLKGEG